MEHERLNGIASVNLRILRKGDTEFLPHHPADILAWGSAREGDQFVHIVEPNLIVPLGDQVIQNIEDRLIHWIDETVSVRGVALSAKDVVRRLKKLGFQSKKQEGSHLQLEHPVKNGKVTIPIHNGTIKRGTLSSILKQANISLPELLTV